MKISVYGEDELLIRFRSRTDKANRVAGQMIGKKAWDGNALTVPASAENINMIWKHYPLQKIFYYGARNVIDGKRIMGENAQLPLRIYQKP